MSISSRTVAVTTTAGRVDAVSETDDRAGQSIAVSNTGAGSVWLGGSDVTSANGYPLPLNKEMTFDLSTGDALYAISDATATLRVLEVGV